MKTKQAFVSSIAMVFLMGIPSAFAANLTKACKSDLKKFDCAAKNDSEAHECLEKNEKEGVKNGGFTAKCHKAHEAFERKMGREEKGEAQGSSESH